MANILIDLTGDEEEKDLSKQKAKKLESKPKLPRREVRKQVINIEGEIVDL
jgi:hypothetical protein